MSQLVYDVTGWVLWREAPERPPEFRFGTLHVRSGRLSFEPLEPLEPLEPGAPGNLQTRPRFIVPGFVDLHSHLAIGAGPQSSDVIRASAWQEIRAGILALREPGSPVRVSPGELPYGRPLVVSSGRHIALEKRYNRGLAVELPTDPREGEKDSRRDALVAEVRRQAASGTGWVKLVGDWIDRANGEAADLDPLWTSEELAWAVRAAHEEGARVAVHTFSPKTIDSLLDAGVDSIEHGTGMTLDQMVRARDLGIAVVPTLLQVQKFPEFASAAKKYPVYAATMTALYDNREEWFANLLTSGVQLLPGSDAGGYQVHGALINELQELTSWGLPAEAVLAAGTWQARDFLGLESLEEGAAADAVVFDRDPRLSSEVWAEPSLVIANGHQVRPH